MNVAEKDISCSQAGIQRFAIEKYASDINMSVENLALLAITRMYYHTYCIWNAFKQVNNNTAVNLYAEFWKRDVKKPFVAVMEALKINEIPNIKVLADIIAYVTSCAPSLYVTKISTEKLHIGYVTWCGNPGILKIPNKTRFCADDYIRAECAIEVDYLNAFVEEARQFGFTEEVEIQSNNPRCANCLSSACQFVIKLKGAAIEPITADKFTFIDYEIGYASPLDAVLKKLDRTYAEQANMSLSSFFAKDLSAWEVLFDLSPNQTQGYYKLIWDSYAELSINELKLKRGLGEIIPTDKLVNELLLFGLNNMLIPCFAHKKTNGSTTYIIDLNQFARVADKYIHKENYLIDVFLMIKNYILMLVQKSGLKNIEINFNESETDTNKLIVDVRCK